MASEARAVRATLALAAETVFVASSEPASVTKDANAPGSLQRERKKREKTEREQGEEKNTKG